MERFTLSAPIRVCIELTNKCNLSCLHCHAKANEQRRGEKLTTSEIMGLIDECASAGVFVLQLSGGEPTLHPEFEQILGNALMSLPTVILSTNGSTASKSFARRLYTLGLRSIQVSLDGATAVTHDAFRGVRGSWAQATSAIQIYSDAGIRARVACTLHRRNAHEIEELISLVDRMGATSFRLLTMMPAGRALENEEWSLSSEESRQIARGLKETVTGLGTAVRVGHDIPYLLPKRVPSQKEFDSVDRYFVGCEAGKQQLRIGWNGEVWPCALIHDERFLSGNIRELSLLDIWQNSKVLKQFREVSYKTRPGCGECDYGFLCNGGCPAESINRAGTIDAPDSRCPYNPINLDKAEKYSNIISSKTV